jgi:CspA family cold shock protein
MASGTIKSLRDRGFGFITPEGGGPRDDVFFHASALVGTAFDQVQIGQRVSFDLEPDPRDSSRMRAADVRIQVKGDQDGD